MTDNLARPFQFRQIKAIEGIKQHPDYQDLKISYGKDRCVDYSSLSLEL
jgi:hypothetical protein